MVVRVRQDKVVRESRNPCLVTCITAIAEWSLLDLITPLWWLLPPHLQLQTKRYLSRQVCAHNEHFCQKSNNDEHHSLLAAINPDWKVPCV